MSPIRAADPADVHEWSFTDEIFDHVTEHHIEEIEPVQTSTGFGFTIDVPTVVRLVAGAFECERLPTVTEAAAPWTSSTEFFVAAQRADRPSPAQWVDALARQGAEVTWRIYGGPAHPTEHVPADYDGWFLERPSRLNEHDGGLFVNIGEQADRVTLKMERNQADSELWHAVCREAVTMFPDGEFSSGNCQFTAGGWLTHLTGTAD